MNQFVFYVEMTDGRSLRRWYGTMSAANGDDCRSRLLRELENDGLVPGRLSPGVLRLEIAGVRSRTFQMEPL